MPIDCFFFLHINRPCVQIRFGDTEGLFYFPEVVICVILSLMERKAVQERILTEIRGRMLEDIALLETKMADPKKQVFVLQFPVGEFDMVVFDPAEGSCKIYEIKHSEEAIRNQYRHLIDKEKCAQTEHRYGPIMEKTVLYRGKNQVIEKVRYQNVEEYLRNIV